MYSYFSFSNGKCCANFCNRFCFKNSSAIIQEQCPGSFVGPDPDALGSEIICLSRAESENKIRFSYGSKLDVKIVMCPL